MWEEAIFVGIEIPVVSFTINQAAIRIKGREKKRIWGQILSPFLSSKHTKRMDRSFGHFFGKGLAWLFWSLSKAIKYVSSCLVFWGLRISTLFRSIRNTPTNDASSLGYGTHCNALKSILYRKHENTQSLNTVLEYLYKT